MTISLPKIDVKENDSIKMRRNSKDTQEADLENLGSKYVTLGVLGKIGKGSFSDVWEAVDAKTQQRVVIKRCREQDQLAAEVLVLIELAKDSPVQGFPEFLWLEKVECCIVLEKLGQSLQDLIELDRSKGYELQTSALLGQQMMLRIEYLHSKGIIHCDIKPGNWMLGINEKIHHLYLIDFGLSSMYWEEGRNRHKPFAGTSRLKGTPRYMSLNVHFGTAASRRDDLESIGYLLLHLHTGTLPWCDLSTRHPAYLKNVRNEKSETELPKLCKDAPPEFELFLQYCRELQFAQRPDYDFLYGLFGNLRHADTEDHHFEWLMPANDDSLSSRSRCMPPVYMLEPLAPRPALVHPDDLGTERSAVPVLQHGNNRQQKKNSLISRILNAASSPFKCGKPKTLPPGLGRVVPVPKAVHT